MKSTTTSIGFLCAIVLFSLPQAALAALDVISVQTKPSTPAPNETVVVTLQSYAIDLNSANITWYVDKNVVNNGVAAKKFEVKTKNFGEPVAIDIVIVTHTGARYDKQIILAPMEIDVLWEANTSVPPFYKGKALPTYKSTVRVSALPRFTLEPRDPSAFSYTWTLNSIENVGGGLGRNSVVIPMKYAGMAIPISVRVSGDQAGEKKEGEVTKNISAVEPLLFFYEQAPLLGVRSERVLSRSTTNGTSFRVRAEPYFFSTDDLANEHVVYTWRKDNQKIATPLNPNMLLLGKNGEQAQTSAVTLTLQNTKRILQSAEGQFSVSFSKE